MIKLSLALAAQPIHGPLGILSALGLIALLVVLVLAAERSIRRQQGSTPRRGREERNAAGRMLEKFFRW
ncbi:MAG TPA: hypothetical protein VFR04_02445 [Solirubrobacterales bacterium]|nr:hypothetical protein [Solirubrobacterales bacterium]